MSCKVLVKLNLTKFKKRLIKELNLMYDYQYRVHSQFKAFKMAREEAQSNADVATIQLDWSENGKMQQSREEKSAYYCEYFVCLHPMYIWTKQCNYSRTALSDCTDHKAPALMTSIRPILNDLVDKGIKKINVVSDSPTSQYQNRRMVWILHCCCKEKMIDLKWIYLESGHGKGIPDGIGATVKKAIKDLPLVHPDDPLCNLGDLFSHYTRLYTIN